MPPSAVEVRRRLRAFRSARKSSRYRIVDVFDAVLYIGMVAGLIIGAAQEGLQGSVAGAGPLTPSAQLGQWLTLLAVILGGSLLLKLFFAFGPVLALEAEQFWLLSTPVDRKSLLSPRFCILLLVALVGGSVLFGFILLADGIAAIPAVTGAALLGVALVALAVTLQPHGTGVRVTRWVTTFVVAACLATSAALMLLRPNLTSPWATGGDLRLGLLLFLGVGTLALVITAYRSLAKLHRASLSNGIELARAVRVSTTFLDGTILSSILTLRWARDIGRVRSAKLRGKRVAILVRADWLRVRRMWRGSVVWAVLLPAPYAAQLLDLGIWIAVVHLVAAFLSVHRLASGLRFVCQSAGMRRTIGGPDWKIRAAHLVIPAAGAAIWCSLTAAAIPHRAAAVAIVSAVGAILVSYRIATKPPLEYSSPILDIGFGGIPIGLVLQLSRGPFLLLILAWLQLSI